MVLVVASSDDAEWLADTRHVLEKWEDVMIGQEETRMMACLISDTWYPRVRVLVDHGTAVYQVVRNSSESEALVVKNVLRNDLL